MFNKQTYIQRRKILAEKIGSGLVLLLGNDESPMNYADNGYHFRQDSTFFIPPHPIVAAENKNISY